MSPEKRWQVRIEHIRQAIEKIQRYTAGMNEATFAGWRGNSWGQGRVGKDRLRGALFATEADMKPGKRDRRYAIRITGAELAALKECCADLPESFGLDRRITAYQGKRPIGFYPWDLDCLVDTLAHELQPPSNTRARTHGRVARRRIAPPWSRTTPASIKALHEEAYREEND